MERHETLHALGSHLLPSLGGQSVSSLPAQNNWARPARSATGCPTKLHVTTRRSFSHLRTRGPAMPRRGHSFPSTCQNGNRRTSGVPHRLKDRRTSQSRPIGRSSNLAAETRHPRRQERVASGRNVAPDAPIVSNIQSSTAVEQARHILPVSSRACAAVRVLSLSKEFSRQRKCLQLVRFDPGIGGALITPPGCAPRKIAIIVQ